MYVSKCKTWKLKVEETQKEYEQKVWDREAKGDRNDEDVEVVWKELKSCLLRVAERYVEAPEALQDAKNRGGGMMETCVLFHAKQCHKNKSKRIVGRIAACTDPK